MYRLSLKRKETGNREEIDGWKQGKEGNLFL